MLYRIIYPLHYMEADNAEKAELYATNAIHESLHLIRVEPVADASTEQDVQDLMDQAE